MGSRNADSMMPKSLAGICDICGKITFSREGLSLRRKDAKNLRMNAWLLRVR